ncbi:tetratricopeptide repeat protein [Yoonia sp. R2331]|uniref:tetratricopeptide repeat protein n=1 Tax=Yoonia sp. R2331 TaxID=3237238 RepID=UPI0034E4334F
MRLAIIALTLAPGLALAAGSGSSSAPKATETVEQCSEGLVFDLATQSCMTPEASTNDDSAMMDDIRSLSHEGRYADALAVLALMPDQNDPLVLTYYGFATRKAGDLDAGLAFYAQALAVDPGNLLARSYRGQAYVHQGRMDLALADLTEIRMLGGRGTWAEASLASAIATGETYSH